MRESTMAGSVLVGIGAAFAFGAAVVARDVRQQRVAGATPRAAVASCVTEIRQSVSCDCVHGALRHACRQVIWRALDGCRAGKRGAALDGGVADGVPPVWCAPRREGATT
jgi:hypothetical protein